MSISTVGSSSQAYGSTTTGSMNQRFKDLQSLDQALQSGSLPDAQSAFAAFQQNLASSNSTQGPFGPNSAATKDVQSIQSALQSGDVSGAQKAVTQLKADLKAGHHGRVGGHHRPPQISTSNDSDTDDSTTSTTTTDFTDPSNLSSPVAQLLRTIGALINQQA